MKIFHSTPTFQSTSQLKQMASPDTNKPTITLYTGQTPNGIKISITLEELSLPYTTYKVNVSSNGQKEPWFLEINPNGRIPALTDTDPVDGKLIRVFESGSIMQYLIDRYDPEYKVSYPRGTREYVEMVSWLYFQNAGVGPMQGQCESPFLEFFAILTYSQANHFFRYCTEQVPYAIERYQNETRRLYGVLEKHLRDAGSEYLVGDKCTVADISHWGWVALAKWSLGGEGDPLDEFPGLKAWEERMFQREGVQRGRQVPDKHQREMLRDPEAMEVFEAKGREFYRKLAEEKNRAEGEGREE